VEAPACPACRQAGGRQGNPAMARRGSMFNKMLSEGYHFFFEDQNDVFVKGVNVNMIQKWLRNIF
jgi:hypothetical protein